MDIRIIRHAAIIIALIMVAGFGLVKHVNANPASAPNSQLEGAALAAPAGAI